METAFVPSNRISHRWTIVDGDLVPTGGMDIANLRLAEFIAQRDELYVITHRADASLESLPNVCVRKVWRPLRSHFMGGFLLDHAGRKASRRIGKSDRKHFVVNGGNCVVPGACNWVHYVHSVYEPHSSAKGLRKIKNTLHRFHALKSERLAVSQAGIVICNSHRTLKDLHESLHIPEQRLRVVYYGVDPERFYRNDSDERMALRKRFAWESNQAVVLFIGALSDRRKGFDTVAEAWRQFCHNPNLDVKLVVVGSGTEKAHWSDYFQKNGLGNRVEILGFRSDVPDLLRAADALVAPTRYEAYGLGVHEAICCGLPAFVSRNSGVAERYPRQLQDSLLLDNPNDANQLMQKLTQWHAERACYARRMIAFSDTLRQRSWDAMAKEFVEIVDAAD